MLSKITELLICHISFYKKSVISNYVRRAYKICSDKDEFNTEIERIKELLMKNSYQKPMIENHIKTVLNGICKNSEKRDKGKTIYYENKIHVK